MTLKNRRRSQKGSEMLEFTLVLLPMLAALFVLLDVSWAVFSKSTLQRAVRVGVRQGVTVTSAQLASGQCLTDLVKSTVQANAMGLLKGSTGLSKIKVNYIQPPDADSSGAATDVSTQIDGNTPGNIMQVSVQNYSLMPLIPRFFSWHGPIDKSPLMITVYSADRIEPNRTPPCKGNAP